MSAQGSPLPPPPPHAPRSSRAGTDYRPPRLSTRVGQFFAPSSASSNPAPSSTSSDPARDKIKDDYNQLLVEHQCMRDDLKRFESENRHLRHANRDIDQDRTRHRENASALQSELRNVQRELDDYRVLSEIRGKELINVKRELEDYRNLSENQGKELMGAQAFLTKADMLSVSELRQKVSDLNDVNYSAAAWFGGALVHAQPRRMSEEESQAAYQVACTMIGEPAVKILAANASKTELDPVIVRLVMQIYLAKFCSTKIEHWYEDGQETNDSLKTIYDEIKHNEEKTISGRWRALTHTYTRPSTDNWANNFTSRLQYIMKIASWEVSHPEIQSAFEQKLKPVFEAILDLRIALGEHFTSADFEVFCPPAGVLFDPQDMEDALFDGQRKKKNGGDGSDASSGGNSAGTIIGTAGLGLREVPRRGTRSSSLVVLLPKVIL